VPDDIAVIGVDDVEDGRYARPSLSTVALDKQGIAQAAVDLLAARIDGDDSPARTVIAGHHLVVRESTAGGGEGRSARGATVLQQRRRTPRA
jgi:DNA-binding LacI/PurR family transcriptional regulator